MADILAKIGAYKREEIAAAKRGRPLAALEQEAKANGAPRGFLRAIERRLAAKDYALIAEVKKAISILPRWRRPMKPAAPRAFRC